ncbi:MAG: hypothetical protein ACT6U0_07765 [Shinella sp.]|uniref:hypothetical protein n=1 Tax=Shinella sp. TaxID=1870904 RepID=UPI0040353F49
MTAPNRDFSNLAALLTTRTHPAEKKQQGPARSRSIDPANDNKVADVLAWPTLARLAHRGDAARVHALRHWKNLNYPGSGYVPPEPDDDTHEPEIEMRPSEAELLRAVGWTVTGRERWPDTGGMVNVYQSAEVMPVNSRNRNGGTDTRLGDLLFRDGELVEWGKTKKGRSLRPVERARGMKGAPPAERSVSAIWSYLRIKPEPASPFAAVSLRRPFSGERAIPDMYEPLPREEPNAKDKHGRFGVEEARALLRERGVDGSVAFEDLPVPATRCPDGLIHGAQWVAGLKKPKPLGEISAAAGREPGVVRLTETTDRLGYLRRVLGDHAKILDLAITDATAKEIAIAMGKAPAYAEKAGPHLIDAAMDALVAIDETARTEITQEEKKIAA